MKSKIVPLIIVLVIAAVAGVLFLNEQKIDQEASLLSAEAQFQQGQMYENGWGRPKNTDEAIAWYTRAADNGYADAQFALANLYYAGVRVEKNLNKAFDWYLQAANNGHVEAEYRLGMMYQNGEGVAEDRVEAQKWLTLAKQQGYDQES